jgi:hypothetical protein
MREACKFNVQIHNGNILMSSVTTDPGVSSNLFFSGSGINFPRPLYKLSGFVNRSHLRTGWWRDNTFRERSSAGLRRRTEWRVCRAQIVRSLDAYLNCRPPTFQPLSYLMFYIMRRGHVWQGANISCRRTYFWT